MMRTVLGHISSALPFWMSLAFIPLIVLAAFYGGWMLALPFIFANVVMTVLDAVFGMEERNLDPDTDAGMNWHRLITLIWCPIQLIVIFGALFWIERSNTLNTFEQVILMLGVGLMSGGIGIVYAHELMHQTNRLERALGEILMISTLYGHFVTEHLAVHHIHVCTPRDPATARYGENIYRFVARVVPGSFRSAWQVEASRMQKRGHPVWGLQNPFWRYIGGALAFLIVAYGIGGWTGVALFIVQASFAIWLLEQINYIEHYGLSRTKVGDKYEPVKPHHSWNAAHKFTNFLLINLQRHSDHHAKPNRRYPMLQTYGLDQAPNLPYGYPVMTLLTYIPPLWARVMHPRVKAWRQRFYPDRSEWT
jgi:alkane 1-monooxygenase